MILLRDALAVPDSVARGALITCLGTNKHIHRLLPSFIGQCCSVVPIPKHQLQPILSPQVTLPYLPGVLALQCCLLLLRHLATTKPSLAS